MTFSLAHLSDPHLPLPPSGPPIGSLTAKQALALASWRRRRCRVTSPALLDALERDVEKAAPDHIVVTGDLVNLAWEPEFAAAQAWLARLGPPDGVSVVPGNHDLTRALPWTAGIGQWGAFMSADQDDAPGTPRFPFLRRRGPLAIIGLSSAIPTRPFSAAGRLGVEQLARAASLLDHASRDGLFRAVLIHHPPVAGSGGRRKALQDRDALCGVLARHGAELVLHGHHHAALLTSLPGPAGTVPVIGAASASSGVARPELAGWRLYKIERDEESWWLTTITRRYDQDTGRFGQAGEWRLKLSVKPQ